LQVSQTYQFIFRLKSFFRVRTFSYIQAADVIGKFVGTCYIVYCRQKMPLTLSSAMEITFHICRRNSVEKSWFNGLRIQLHITENMKLVHCSLNGRVVMFGTSGRGLTFLAVPNVSLPATD